MKYGASSTLNAIYAEVLKMNDFSKVINIYLQLFKVKHAQKRYLMIKLLDLLLMKYSSEIGIHVMENLEEIVQSSLEKLMPKEWNSKLKEFMFESLEKWSKLYPEKRAFKIAYQQILDLHQGDSSRIYFPRTEIPKKLMQVYNRTFVNITQEYEKYQDEFMEIENKIESSIELLMEAQHVVFGKDVLSNRQNNGDLNLPMQQDIQKYGLGTSSYKLSVSIDLNKFNLNETEENSILFHEIRDSCKLIQKKYLPKVVDWMKKISKVELEEQQEFLKKLILLRNRLDQILNNVRNLGISWDKVRVQIPVITQDSDEDEEFVMISENSHTLKSNDYFQGDSDAQVDDSKIQSSPPASQSGDPESQSGDDKSLTDSQNAGSRYRNDKQKTNVSPEKASLLERAPIVTYDEDLEYWDKTEIPFNTSGLEFQHRFLGTGAGERNISKETLRLMKMRTISLPMPEKVVIKRSCNAPIRNGKLCQRKDLVKCPIHGIIIERNSMGNPLDHDANDANETTIPEWQKLEEQVSRLHPVEKMQSQIEDLQKKNAKQRIESKLKRKNRDSSQDFEANMKLRDRQAFKW